MGEADSFIDRTLRRLRSAWRDLAGRRHAPSGESFGVTLADGDTARLRAVIDDCLAERGGAVSALARTAAIGDAYLRFDPASRARFLLLLAERYGPDRDGVDAAARAMLGAAPATRFEAERTLAAALTPPRGVLFRKLGALPEGIKFLVDLRAEMRQLDLPHDARRRLDLDLRALLVSWFDPGFLQLRRITWESPAGLLERLIAYEAVHEIRSWSDLKNRLDSDRRCFAFFHPRMPEEPLIFVEVALVAGMAGSIQSLLDEAAPAIDPHAADTAIFYSISNAQRGLDGIGFGDFLIKRVVDLLRAEFPNLKTFGTLSPLPRFRRWLDRGLESDPDTVAALAAPEAASALRAAFDQRDPHDAAAAARLKAPLLRLAAHYLLRETWKGRAADPVAHFHLTNGARVERLNYPGDVSKKGRTESATVMVNYLYALDDIESNHEAYRGDGRIAASTQVRALLEG